MIEYQKLIQERHAVVNIKHRPIINRVEIELISYCNLKCFACNRFCTNAPTNDQMSVSQIETFVRDSIDFKKKWENIAVMGGEPSLHPDLKDILKIIKRYYDFYNTRITFISNGIGEKVKSVLNSLPAFLEKHTTTDIKMTRDKNNIIPEFGNCLQAPIDRLKSISRNGVIDSCQIAATCGMGLNRYGYGPCGVGASIARVLGIDLYAKSLRDISVEKSIEQLKILCLFCGRNLEYNITCKQNSTISEFWKLALENYKINKPLLALCK